VTPEQVVAQTVAGLRAGGARDVEVLARREGATLVVALTLLPDGRRVVAKARTGPFGTDGSRAASALRAVTAGVGGARELAVPAVLLHDPATGLLVTAPAPGERLDRLVLRGELDALRRTGTALAELHALPVVAGPRVRLDDCLADLARPHPLALAALLPPLADRVLALLDGVLDAEPDGPARAVHRDVHLRQVHSGAGRTWLLDWDLAAQGDPALDLGNLVGTLRAKLPPAQAEPAVDALLTGYAAADSTRALDRVGPFEAFTYLRLACKQTRLGAPAPQVADLLARGLRRLEQRRVVARA
jgi:Phosphotransferase enzyme family